MKTLLLVLTLLAISSHLKSQPSCIIEYAYKGKIVNKNEIDSATYFLKFPSSCHLIGFKERMFPQKVTLKTNAPSYQGNYVSIGVSRFCTSKENIIKNIFQKHKVYKIVLVHKGRRKVYKINVTEISFQWNPSILEINLPDLYF